MMLDKGNDTFTMRRQRGKMIVNIDSSKKQICPIGFRWISRSKRWHRTCRWLQVQAQILSVTFTSSVHLVPYQSFHSRHDQMTRGGLI